MMIAIVDTEEKINQLIPILDTMVQEGLVVLSDVEVIKYSLR
jgi:PII-like signaling protein